MPAEPCPHPEADDNFDGDGMICTTCGETIGRRHGEDGSVSFFDGTARPVRGDRRVREADDATGFNVAPARYNQGDRETIDVLRDEAETEWDRIQGDIELGAIADLSFGDIAFRIHCVLTAKAYEARAGKKGPAEEDLAKARWYRQMADCVTGEGPDPRVYRAGFEPYKRQK